jgi:hypothetical protein
MARILMGQSMYLLLKFALTEVDAGEGTWRLNVSFISSVSIHRTFKRMYKRNY